MKLKCGSYETYEFFHCTYILYASLSAAVSFNIHGKYIIICLYTCSTHAYSVVLLPRIWFVFLFFICFRNEINCICTFEQIHLHLLYFILCSSLRRTAIYIVHIMHNKIGVLHTRNAECASYFCIYW